MQVKATKRKFSRGEDEEKLVWNLENGKIAIAIYQLLFNIQSFQNRKRFDCPDVSASRKTTK